jgi:LAS superfamily LD-carboxypeptidase LdcB
LGQGFPEITITEVFRTPEQQEAIYWKSLLASEGTEERARAAARAKWSWHLGRCAVDFRSHSYSKTQQVAILNWLQERCPKPAWETLLHAVGSDAEHFHVGFRDYSRRRRGSA